MRVYRPRFTVIFIALCVTISILGTLSPILQSNFRKLSFTPAYAFSKPWTFVTSIFLHADIFPNGDFLHIFWNMFALFMFGTFLESRIGPKNFLAVFFLAGILGNFAYFALAPNSKIPAVGASGAIFGIIGTLAILYPRLVVWMGLMPMPIIFAAFIWAIISFIGIFTAGGGIAHEAHLAGLLFGGLYGFYLRKKMLYRRMVV